MAKKKTLTSTGSLKAEEFNTEPIAEQEEAAAVKSVAKKKGLSSFGSMLKAASAKRKERNLKFKDNGKGED